MTVGQDFIVTGVLAEQTRLCALLGSSVPVEHQTLCPVPQEHMALTQGTPIKKTAPSAPLDTSVKVGNVDFSRGVFREKNKHIYLHLKFPQFKVSPVRVTVQQLCAFSECYVNATLNKQLAPLIICDVMC